MSVLIWENLSRTHLNFVFEVWKGDFFSDIVVVELVHNSDSQTAFLIFFTTMNVKKITKFFIGIC